MKRRPGFSPIVPAEPVKADDGTPYSDVFDDAYLPVDGALERARQVFLGGNGLPQRWQGREQFVIVETGFGLGLNFLATWAAWRDDPQRPKRLHFVSVEKFPFRPRDLRQTLAPLLVQPGMTELAPLVQRLCDIWPLPVAGWHRLEPAPGVVLSVGFGDFSTLMPDLRVGADAFSRRFRASQEPRPVDARSLQDAGQAGARGRDACDVHQCRADPTRSSRCGLRDDAPRG